MKNLFLLFFCLLFAYISIAQTQPFEIILEPIEIAEFGGVQSYAFGTHNGQWLIVGGRLDGLHRRQPWATFDEIGHNTQLIRSSENNYPIKLDKQSKANCSNFSAI